MLYRDSGMMYDERESVSTNMTSSDEGDISIRQVYADLGINVTEDADILLKQYVNDFMSLIINESVHQMNQKENQKTLSGENILYVLTVLGYDEFVPTLASLIKKCRIIQVKSKDKLKKRKGGNISVKVDSADVTSTVVEQYKRRKTEKYGRLISDDSTMKGL